MSPRVEKYREEHEQLLGIADKLMEKFDGAELDGEVSEVHGLLSKFKRKLKSHLSGEDNDVYPYLIDHEKQEVRKIARKYQQEMGDLQDKFEAFAGRWSRAKKIKNDSRNFVSETRKIISTVEARIEREDEELYPLLDN